MKNPALSIVMILLMCTLSLPAFNIQDLDKDKNTFPNDPNKAKYVNLTGIVKNYEGDPVPAAVIIIPEISKSTETDKTGFFELRAVPPGKYHIMVIAEGYMDFKSDIFDLTKTGKKINITLFKKLSEEIVVTATRTPKLYIETPVKTEVISARKIEQMQASQLAESLALTTGVRVENNCQNCNFTQVRINGMEGKYCQILIDNSPIFSSMIGVYGLEQIPAEMLNRVEVVKGGGSALYGGNAVAGVINVLTKEPMSNQSSLKLHQETVKGEPFTNMGFHTSMVSKSGNTKGFLFANYKSRAPIDLDNDDFSEIGKMKSTNFGLNLYKYFEEIKGKLKFGFFRITENRRGGNKFELPAHEADIAEAIDSNLTGISTDWNHFLTKKVYYTLSMSYVDAARNSYYGAEQDPNAYGKTKNPVFFLNGQMNYQAGPHLLSTGIQYKREYINDKALGYGRKINTHYREFGLFIQDDVKFNNTFSLLAGLRLSKHSQLESYTFIPRTSLLINFSKEISWRTTFSTGYRAPQVFDEDLHITQVGGEGMLIENSPGLLEERSYGLSTGLDFGKQLGNNSLQCSVEGFYTALTNTFMLKEKEFDPRENARVFERINGSASKVYGASIDFGVRLGSQFFLNSGWTFQRSHLDEPEPDFGSKCFFRTPNTYGYIRLNLEREAVVDADVSLEYTGPMTVPHFAGYIAEDRLEKSGSFWVVNAKLKKTLYLSDSDKISLFLGVFNLLDSYQEDLDKGIYRDAGYIYGPQKPRSFYAGFEFSF